MPHDTSAPTSAGPAALALSLALGCALGCALVACGPAGQTLYQTHPGREAILGSALGLGVDPEERRAWLQIERSGTEYVAAADLDTGACRIVADLSELSDVRVLFPPGRVLLMGQRADALGTMEQLRLLDADTLGEERHVAVRGWYNGTRLAPGGRHVVVSDNDSLDARNNLQRIDLPGLSVTGLPYDGVGVEAMWANRSDRLVAVLFGVDPDDPDAVQGPGWVRLVVWDFSAGPKPAPASAAAPRQAAPPPALATWPEPSLQIDLTPAAEDEWPGGMTWIMLSPDDRTAVVPTSAYLIAVDLETGVWQILPELRGPVGFTGDSERFVAYTFVEPDDQGSDPVLVLIDRDTLAQERVRLPWDRGLSWWVRGSDYGPQYLVTEDGRFVLATGSFEDANLFLYDVERRVVSEFTGLRPTLERVVQRRAGAEVWLLDDGLLFRVAPDEASVEQIALPGAAERLNLLVRRDRLLLESADGDRLWVFDPESRTVERELALDCRAAP